MINQSKAFGSFSVKDLQAAKDFYANKLGLDVREMEYGLELHFSDSNTVFIYPKPDHTPATFTILNFPVGDIDRTVDELAAKGIRFEPYEGDMKTDEKGIYRGSASQVCGPDIAWFKDPSGNFLSVIREEDGANA